MKIINFTKRPTVQLESTDHVIFELDLRLVQDSQMVMETVQATGDYAIYLPTIPSNILRKVIQYFLYNARYKYNINDNPCITEDEVDEFTRELKQWDNFYLEVDYRTLVGVIKAASFMNIRPLIDLTCQRVADLINNRSPKEIKMAKSCGLGKNNQKSKKQKARTGNHYLALQWKAARAIEDSENWCEYVDDVDSSNFCKYDPEESDEDESD
ncbi:unnamed protein product [Calypogeia fissa]